tara:strand:+ start:1954 stop:2379 length:426 start_codon:yes stop_codon:yes gene_type:complete
METYLCYINKMGANYKGENLYEFIFTTKSNLPLVDGESWDKTPADGFPHPPKSVFIKEVASLTTNEITLNVIQDSNFFGVYDAVDNIIALGWEHIEEDFDGMENLKRLVFHYGETNKSVEEKLYSRDIILKTTKSPNLETK